MPTTADHPRELTITGDDFYADLYAAKVDGVDSFNGNSARKATTAERNELRGTTLYRARRNSRGDWRDGTHREVIDVQTITLTEVGAAWTTYHDQDYSFARHRIRTTLVIDSLERGGLSDFHRTEAELDAAVARHTDAA